MANKTICYPHSGKNSDPPIYVLNDIFFLTAKFFIAKKTLKSQQKLFECLCMYSVFLLHIYREGGR